MPKISPDVQSKDQAEKDPEHPGDDGTCDDEQEAVPDEVPDADSEDEMENEMQKVFGLPEDDEESEDDIEAETDEESDDDVDEALERAYRLPDDSGLSADRFETTSVEASDDEIEKELERICGLPDDPEISEDDLEVDPESSSTTLLDLLASSDDSDDAGTGEDTETQTPVDEPQPCSSGLQYRNRNQTSNPQEAAAFESSDAYDLDDIDESEADDDDDETDTDHSDDDEVDWKKKKWTQEPNLDSFDAVRLKGSHFFPGKTRPVCYFTRFFDDDVIKLIVTQTNKYAEQNRTRNWKPVTAAEIRAYLGISILMGLNPLPSIDLYWSSDPFFRSEEIASIMTCKRFKKITENLHLNDNQTKPPKNSKNVDKLYKLRPLLDLLNAACHTEAHTTSSQSIDESMILFKGRSSLKQYMPLKPIKRGYKVWVRAASETGYVFEFDVYTGKRDDKLPTIGLGANVVKNLTQKLIDQGFQGHISFDSFFTNYAIMQHLFDHGIYATATVNANRSDLPIAIKNRKSKSPAKTNKKMLRGQYKWRTKENVGFVMWQDSKIVTLLTTAYNPETEKTTCQRKQKDGSRKTIECPTAILEYTKRMGGVDRFDQKRSTYTVGRRSKKWWMRIFNFCIDLAITNAYLLYTTNSRVRNPLSQLQFRLELARNLVGGYTSRKRGLQSEPKYSTKKRKMSPNYQKAGVPDDLRLSDVGSHRIEELTTYRRCRLCSAKANNKRSKIQCSKCKVPLCVTPSFNMFHDTMD